MRTGGPRECLENVMLFMFALMRVTLRTDSAVVPRLRDSSGGLNFGRSVSLDLCREVDRLDMSSVI